MGPTSEPCLRTSSSSSSWYWHESVLEEITKIFHMVAEHVELVIGKFNQFRKVHDIFQIHGGFTGEERSNKTSQPGQALPLQVTDQAALQITIHMLGASSSAHSRSRGPTPRTARGSLILGASEETATLADQNKLREYMAEAALQTSAENSGRFFENQRPPVFSGKREDFEAWSQRFEWFIRLKSAAFFGILQRVSQGLSEFPPGLSLEGLGTLVAHKMESTQSGRQAIQMLSLIHI